MQNNNLLRIDNVAILDARSLPVTLHSYETELIPDYLHSETVQPHEEIPTEASTSEISKQAQIWTKPATLMLLNSYKNKLHLMENPKKKTKIWASIAEELKSMNLEFTADQVRWKINALTKKYRNCVDKSLGASSFKYFNEMQEILGNYSEQSSYRLASGIEQIESQPIQNNGTSTSPLRKIRNERRAKIELEKYWLEYLKRQEQQKKLRDEKYDTYLRLKEEELQIRKMESEMRQKIALKKLELREKRLNEMLKVEKEKCVLLQQLISNNNNNETLQ